MVATRAQAMANEKIDKLEQSLQAIQAQLDKLTDALFKGKEETREEAYIGNGHSEGESRCSLHLWGIHQNPVCDLPSWICINLMVLIRPHG